MEQAVRARTAAKSWLTRASKELENILTTAEENPEQITEVNLIDCIEQFSKRLSIFDESQAAVELVIDMDNLESDINQTAAFRNSRRTFYIQANELLEKLRSKCIQENRSNSSDSPSNSLNAHQATLPKLELPKFSGDYTQWQTFWEKFVAAVDSSNIATVNKFSYLQSLLHGEAATSIRGLSLTADNYNTAKEILVRRFGKPERIVFSHIQNLLQINHKTNNGSVTALWKLYDDIQTNVRSLQNLGVGGDTYGVILTPLILHQLPPNIRLEWARVGEDHEGDLEFLLKFLYDEIRRRERSQAFGSGTTSSRSDKPLSTSTVYAERKSTNSALLAPGAKPISCAFCRDKHYSDKCPNIKDLDFDNRKNKIKELGLCFRCLNKHLAKDCNKTCFYCKGNHHAVLCQRHIIRTRETTRVMANLAKEKKSHRQTLLQIAEVRVKGEKCALKANLLFDSGSDRSYISSSLVGKVKPKRVGQELISVSLFGDPKPHAPKMKKIYEIKLLNEDNVEENLIVMESSAICSPIYRPVLPGEIMNKLIVNGISIPEGSLVSPDAQIEIDILIGVDYYWKFVKPNVQIISEHLSAQETKFGWVLSGSWEMEEFRPKSRVNHQFLCMGDVQDKMCHKFWDLESVGIQDAECDENKISDENVLEEFNDSIRFMNGRYVVHLPWKKGRRNTLIDNKEMALKRAINLSKRLKRDSCLESAYNEVLNDLENRGIIHEISHEEKIRVNENQNPIFYLPHRPVIREASATTKIRPVFDASTKGSNGYSLNDCLEPGPNLIPNLVEILLRFRRWKFGLTADISKAFLQIRVVEEDQDVHRFVWHVQDEIRTMRFDRVVFGNTSSPFLLNATIRFHLKHFENSKVVDELNENLYVDDWLTGADSQEEIAHMARDAENVMGKGGFPLAKWGSNSTIVNQRLIRGFENESSDTLPCLKILGISWSTGEDCFYFETIPLAAGLQFTKRLVLSFLARIFDPIGFLNPYVIGIKIMFQQIWRLGLSWDEPLPSDMQDNMSAWVSGFEEINQWRIPRCLAIDAWNRIDHLSLFGFSDASEKAYGGCVYLRVTEGDTSKVSLLISRARVAPLKGMTLPRLELMGALIVARLIVFVKRALKLPADISYICFTDSMIALNWIKADPNRWKQFVANRVREIQTLTSPSNWTHCAGKSNPADLITRGITATELVENDFWIQGSSTTSKIFDLPFDQLNTQVLDSKEEASEACDTDTVLTVIEHVLAPLVAYERFSKFSRLVRTIAWMKRFIFNLRTLNCRSNNDLEQWELQESERFLFMSVQREAFAEEIKALRSNKSIGKRSALYKLRPFLGDDGLLRIQGRLQMTEALSYEEKHPIILPRCHVSLLLVRFQHTLMKHAGVSTLLSCLRDKYWIIGLRRLAKSVCHECVSCQRHDSRACSQTEAPLPRDRIQRSAPFSVVGVDHAGPVYCSDTGDKKYYILLFTCGVVRAIHLELVPSLSLDDFILAFRKFCARRGIPNTIYSDNAKTFKGAEKLLKRLFGPNTPNWKFSAPLAPWWGGWWERLVRSTKSALRKSLGRESVTKSQFETILTEVEGCINSRPLTYVAEDSAPLTPSHFLLGRSTPFLLPEACESETYEPQGSQDFYLRNYESNLALERFWNLWNREYIRNLPTLGRKATNTDLHIGSVVMIREEGKPRMKWPLGKIDSLHYGRDGMVRAVTLQTEKGEIVRAVQKLHKLEVSQSNLKPRATIQLPPSVAEGTGTDEGDHSHTSDVSIDKNLKFSAKGRLIKPRQILDL